MQNSGAFTQETDTRLWIPGTHAADARVRAVARAVEQYDESFRFAKHELTGDWVVTIGEQGHPVFGFGRELPAPEDVEHKLAAHDIKRHGAAFLRASGKDAEAQRMENDRVMSERNGELAEVLEVGFRRQGKHSSPRIFVPRTW